MPAIVTYAAKAPSSPYADYPAAAEPELDRGPRSELRAAELQEIIRSTVERLGLPVHAHTSRGRPSAHRDPTRDEMYQLLGRFNSLLAQKQ
jgi:hypothetical protein